MKRLPKWLSRVAMIAGLTLLVVILLLALDGAFSRKVPPPSAGSVNRPASQPAGMFEARFVEVPVVEQAPGTIRPLHETSLASKLREPEKVVEVNVVAGQAVHKGDVLVRLDSTTWQNRKEMAEAKFRSAQIARDDAQKNFDRIKEARTQGVATPAEMDTATYRLEGAQSELAAVQRALNEASMNLEDTRLVAPMDAVVVDKRADVGDTVSAGQVLVSLYDQMQLVAPVREGLMKHLQVGQRIDVQLEELNANCAGTISEIVPQTDPATRSFDVKVVGPCRPGVRPGMYAKLLVPMGSRKVLVIPPGAVKQVGQLTMVDVVGPAGPQRRSVQLGRPLALEGVAYLEVLSGLNAGETVEVVATGDAAHGQ